MTEQEYRQVDRISYSKLAGLAKSPSSLISTYSADSAGVTFGTMVDMLLFDDISVFNSKYCCISSTPSKSLMNVIDTVVILNNPFGSTNFPPLSECEENIEKACTQLKYGQTWKSETRLTKILNEVEYYNQLKECLSKQVVDAIDVEKAQTAAKTIKNHQFTSHYITPKAGEEIFFQVPVLWEFNGMECKSLFDMLKVDHNNKTIQVNDLKTSAFSVYSFRKAYNDWKYYIQGSFYTDALLYAQENPEAFQIDIPDTKGYKLLPFDFVVIGQPNVTKPLVWRTPPEFMIAGRDGGFVNGVKVRGYKQLIEDYIWHSLTERYSYSKEIYDSKGVVSLKIENGNS